MYSELNSCLSENKSQVPAVTPPVLIALYIDYETSLPLFIVSRIRRPVGYSNGDASYEFYIVGIRETLTDDEDHICPKCDEIDVSPDQLLPDVVLRQAIISFNSKTSVGVVRKKPVSGVASPAPPVSSPARLAV